MIPVHEETVHPYAITVWLSNEPTESRIKKGFRCIVCGNIVFEYYDSVRMIMPGIQGFVQAPIIIQCHGMLPQRMSDSRRCRCKYHIQ